MALAHTHAPKAVAHVMFQINTFSALLFQRRRRGKLSGASLNGKLCSSLEAHDEQVTGLKHSVVVIVT